MTGVRLSRAAGLLGIGVLIGLALSVRPIAVPRILNDAVAQSAERSGQADLASLRADMEVLKQKATDQAHVMASVAYHFNNLWFAGQHGNWPLAQFYWNEVRSHLRWAVRVIPVRKDDQGRDIQLGDILEAMENTPLARLLEAIEAKDRDQFVAAYRFSLETCYACHKASDKPYLRPQIPTHPADPTINFDPAATWPR
jgi:DNA-binding GntR family transcriptional regulator